MTTDAPRRRSVWRHLGAGAGGAALLLLTAAAIWVVGLPWVTGSTPLTVLSRSMEPALTVGTLAVVRPVEASEVRIGDVITFRTAEQQLITHRVVAVTMSTAGGTTFRTKGDANGTIDEAPVVADQLRGKLWYSVPLAGHLNSAVGEHRSWLVVAFAAALFGYAGWMLVGGLVQDRRRRKGAEPPAHSGKSPQPRP